MHYVYVIYDRIVKKYYIGYSEDVIERFREHKRGNVETTSKFKSLELVYTEGCISKKDAQRRERELKTGFGRGYIKKRIRNYLMGQQKDND